jgi:hypothetical protein
MLVTILSMNVAQVDLDEVDFVSNDQLREVLDATDATDAQVSEPPAEVPSRGDSRPVARRVTRPFDR